MALDPAIGFAGQKPGLAIVQACAAKAFGTALQAGFVDITGNDMAPVVHVAGDGQRLAPGSGAEIDHLLSGSGTDQQRDKLGTLVLNFDLAGL